MAYVPNGPSTWVASPNRTTLLVLAPSSGVTATPTITGLAVPIVDWSDWSPIATAPSSITEIDLLARNCWPQVVPSSSADRMKHV